MTTQVDWDVLWGATQTNEQRRAFANILASCSMGVSGGSLATREMVGRQHILDGVDELLTRVEDVLDQKGYPFRDDILRAAADHTSAKALIECVEVWDCGSVGGFGERIEPDGKITLQANTEGWHNTDYDRTLRGRLRWLQDLYGKKV